MGCHDGPMRPASAQISGNEVASVVWSGGTLPVAQLPPDPGGWPTDLPSLLFSFCPHLLTWDEVGKLGALKVATVLNGEVRRRNTFSNMTFSPYRLVSFHSRVMTLLPSNDTT
jgi:hypothetical protein